MLDGGGYSTPHSGRFTPKGKDPVHDIYRTKNGSPVSVMTSAENLAPPPLGFDPWIVQLVTSCYTDWAITAPGKVGKAGHSIDGFVKSVKWSIDQRVFHNCEFVPDRVDAGEINLDPDY